MVSNLLELRYLNQASWPLDLIIPDSALRAPPQHTSASSSTDSSNSSSARPPSTAGAASSASPAAAVMLSAPLQHLPVSTASLPLRSYHNFPGTQAAEPAPARPGCPPPLVRAGSPCLGARSVRARSELWDRLPCLRPPTPALALAQASRRRVRGRQTARARAAVARPRKAGRSRGRAVASRPNARLNGSVLARLHTICSSQRAGFLPRVLAPAAAAAAPPPRAGGGGSRERVRTLS